MKSLSIPNAIRVESEINQMIYLVSDNDILFEIFLLTSSKVGSGWTGWDLGSHFHIVCPGEMNQLKGHL